MPEYLCAAGPVTMFYPDGPVPDTGVVGPPPQWADGSDATYAALRSGVLGGGDGQATAPLTPLTADPATVTAMSIIVRIAVDPDLFGGVGLNIIGNLSTPALGPFVGIAYGPEDELIQDGEIHEYEMEAISLIEELVSPELAAETLLAMATWATDEPVILVQVAGTYSEDNLITARVYEVEIRFFYEGEVVQPYRPTRLYPRGDGYGLSSAPRIVGGIF